MEEAFVIRLNENIWRTNVITSPINVRRCNGICLSFFWNSKPKGMYFKWVFGQNMEISFFERLLLFPFTSSAFLLVFFICFSMLGKLVLLPLLVVLATTTVAEAAAAGQLYNDKVHLGPPARRFLFEDGHVKTKNLLRDWVSKQSVGLSVVIFRSDTGWPNKFWRWLLNSKVLQS